jgi:L-ribulose-5-phosphate 4-epimerase
MLETLKDAVCRANRDLCRHGLVTLTWGNVSGLDRERKLVVIKPSGVDYEELLPKQMVVVDLEGKVVEGNLKPSSDTPTHVCLYRNFPQIGGITHTHSRYATAFAQARREIPCLGTTHADHFRGAVPVTRPLAESEVAGDYERHTGDVIVERFQALDPTATPAVLVAGHGPFAWGGDAGKSVENAVALEAVAEMAMASLLLNPQLTELESYLREKHFLRKHGVDAYYGQK